MAVRFSADGQDYVSSTPGLSTFPLTVLCWGYISTDRNAATAFWCLDNNATTNIIEAVTDVDGTSLYSWSMPNSRATNVVVNMAVGSWYRMAVVINGSGAGTMYGAAAGSALASQTYTINTITTSGITRLRIGEDAYNADWLNGRVANFKLYSAALSQAEIEVELGQYVPVRTTNLLHWHPFVGADTADYSGNGNSFTGGAGAATEDGPPIPWSRAVPIPVPVAPRRASNF